MLHLFFLSCSKCSSESHFSPHNSGVGLPRSWPQDPPAQPGAAELLASPQVMPKRSTNGAMNMNRIDYYRLPNR